MRVRSREYRRTCRGGERARDEYILKKLNEMTTKKRSSKVFYTKQEAAAELPLIFAGK